MTRGAPQPVRRRPVFGAASLAALAAVGLAGAGQAAERQPVFPKLTPRLQDLLRREMQSILEASQTIVAALATGDHAALAQTAQQIYDSFILEQSLTEQDTEDLMAAVPPEFVELDRAFHNTALKLAEAARSRDSELEQVYFAKLTEACVACHGRYASDMFPSLKVE